MSPSRPDVNIHVRKHAQRKHYVQSIVAWNEVTMVRPLPFEAQRQTFCSQLSSSDVPQIADIRKVFSEEKFSFR